MSDGGRSARPATARRRRRAPATSTDRLTHVSSLDDVLALSRLRADPVPRLRPRHPARRRTRRPRPPGRRAARVRVRRPMVAASTGCCASRSRQIRERGFEAHEDDTPLSSIEIIESEVEVADADLLAAAARRADRNRRQRGASTSTTTPMPRSSAASSTTRSATARAPTSSIGRNYERSSADWNADKALTIFRRLLEAERGAYWTFLVFTGDRYLVGASPERHISVHGGEVRMNPISGTFRVGASGSPPSSRRGCWTSSPTRRRSTSSSWSSTKSSR